jgi:small conductance mechanosensitive channel
VPTFEDVLMTDLLDPSKPMGAVVYAVLFVLLAILLSTMVRRHVRRLLESGTAGGGDRTSIVFISQLLRAAVFVVAIILYFHLIPSLRSFATAILTTASVASIVFGLAAQNTIGNVISGVSLLAYKPFAVGDEVEVSAPGGVEVGRVVSITLGYTTLAGAKDRRIVVPNSVLASSVIVHRPGRGQSPRDSAVARTPNGRRVGRHRQDRRMDEAEL